VVLRAQISHHSSFSLLGRLCKVLRAHRSWEQQAMGGQDCGEKDSAQVPCQGEGRSLLPCIDCDVFECFCPPNFSPLERHNEHNVHRSRLLTRSVPFPV
jgi:hypothetical protein